MKKEYYLQKDNKHTHTQPEERKEKQIAQKEHLTGKKMLAIKHMKTVIKHFPRNYKTYQSKYFIREKHKMRYKSSERRWQLVEYK